MEWNTMRRNLRGFDCRSFHSTTSEIPPALLYCDSRSLCHITANLCVHERTKHIGVNCHIIREKLQVKLFCLLHHIQSMNSIHSIYHFLFTKK
ncbi:hypothetical protein MTR_5g098670 [Medicago truncatula]|uniref:Copia protein n=1 Tax=Medicago truncatula TaxID=3880 RepID=G7K0P5_MEDTR|nr:hypothetical protein MTR_5g098670 [Medicago truncatula]